MSVNLGMTKEFGNLLFSLSIFICLAVNPNSSTAYVLGGIKINSSVNEPLNADIPLTDISSEEIDGLRVQLLKELVKLDEKKQSKKTKGSLPLLSKINLTAKVMIHDGRPYIHITSASPIYINCSKAEFNCYRFYRFGIAAQWRSQTYMRNSVRRNYSIIPQMDQALGDIKLNSGIGQRLNADIDLLGNVKDLSDINIRLAPKEAWIQGVHSGEREYKIAQKLRIRFQRLGGKLRLLSKGVVNKIYTNRIQTNNAPIVLLLEISWPEGRELKKYTIYMPV